MSTPKSPLKAQPTNRDLQEQGAELHECLHDTRAQLDAMQVTIGEDREASETRDKLLDGRLRNLERNTEALVQFFGVPKPDPASDDGDARHARPKKTVAGWSRWAAMSTLFTTAVAAMGAYHIIEPPIVAFFIELQHALMAAH